ncbi:anti-repressor SinI family protein [Peribacillus sp. SCS-155]|uniref:anti-repressor SinI family protein n=1 Tax=Peribacillus sedimenti TaxID=3115297 RepID=UPI003905C4D5
MTARLAMEAEFDQEWIELVKQAKEIGLMLDEVREFIYSNQKTDENQKSPRETLGMI